MQEALAPVRAECDEPMRTHHTCLECYPEDFMGMEALCGEKLLGIDAPDDDVDCAPCVEAEFCVRGHLLEKTCR